MSNDLNVFNNEIISEYKGEKYSVRDNGSVLRHPKDDSKPRPTDNKWTFGKVDVKNGYMLIAGERVHRIVCYAFHGNPPTKEYVVDHIDTNRQNNRVDNLRWGTKLENALNNPITRKKIILQCGSIEEFLKNPSILRENATEPNFDWMRNVTPSEAKISKEKLLEWAASDSVPSGGTLGEWIFESNKNKSINNENSLTEGVFQLDWKTPSEFPKCPSISDNTPIKTYAGNLTVGDVFMKNRYGTSRVHKIALSDDEKYLYVITKAEDFAIKEYALAIVYFENNLYVHQSKGTFFTEEGAMKQFTLAQGLEWDGEDSIDDFA